MCVLAQKRRGEDPNAAARSPKTKRVAPNAVYVSFRANKWMIRPVPSSRVRTTWSLRLWFVRSSLSPISRWADAAIRPVLHRRPMFHLACRGGRDVCYACCGIAWWYDSSTRGHCNAATSSSSSGCDPSDQKPAHDISLPLLRLSRPHHIDTFPCSFTAARRWETRIRHSIISSSNLHA